MKHSFYQFSIFILFYVNGILSDCNVCQSSNYVACHKENVYSLCINGIATKDYITCPENHVCTDGPYVCYPLPEAKPSCAPKTNLCGVCSENKVYACVNETTIAFCYGQNEPLDGADVSYCLGDTVCDIYSTKGFCTESYLTKPSCSTQSDDDGDDDDSRFTTITTESTTSTEPTTITTTTEPTTATTPTEPTTTTTTTAASTKPRDPNTICKDADTTGSFYADDPTCTSFVVCYIMSGSIYGLKKFCPSGQYFPPGAEKCAADKPDSCI